MKRFWFLFGVDIAAALVAFGFFVIGIADGSVSSFNIGIWLALLAGVSAVPALGWLLNANGRRSAAIGILSILAVPALLVGLLLLAAVVLQPRWN